MEEEKDHNGKPISYWGGKEKREEVMQETLEEAVVRLNKTKDLEVPFVLGGDHILDVANACYKEGVRAGAQWQAERMFSKAQIVEHLNWRTHLVQTDNSDWLIDLTNEQLFDKWFETNKKK